MAEDEILMRFSHHRFFLLDTDSQTFIKPWFPSAGHDIAAHAVVGWLVGLRRLALLQ
jgi:hypothetical protein